MDETAKMHHWTWWRRVLFRLAFLFWGDFCHQQGVSSLFLWVAPWFNTHVMRWPFLLMDWPINTLVWWFSRHVFHLTKEALSGQPTGSGDTAIGWITGLSTLIFATVGTLTWTAIAEWGIAKRAWQPNYRTLYAWLRLIMRFTLASVLLSYGFAKVFDLQFSPPGAWRLNETYGASSPMGLLWTFMGVSVAYTIFAGAMEVIPGVLLLFRRTSTLGALSAAAVMFNVVMLNFCYDVPVKLYSTELFLMAAFLLLPDLTPLWRLLILRKPAQLTGVWVPRIERRPLRIAGYCLQALVIGHLLYVGVRSGYNQRKDRNSSSTSAPTSKPKIDPQYANLDGIWIVDSSTGWPDDQRWQTITLGELRYQSIDFLEAPKSDGAMRNYGIYLDWQHNIHFLDHPDSLLHWSVDPHGAAMLEGTWLGKPAKLIIHPLSASPAAEKKYPLMTRGFHWVQELPYNR